MFNTITKSTNCLEENDDSIQSASLLSQSKSFAEQQWQKASSLLQTKPTLMTQAILCLALKHNPPTHVVQYMLQLNPKAAGIPKTGPTPLQMAVQNSCSAEVVELLIKACPYALVETNPGSRIDPLTYAKRFRSDEDDLIEMLSRPLSQWLEPCSEVPEKTHRRGPTCVLKPVNIDETPLAPMARLGARPRQDTVGTEKIVGSDTSSGLSEADKQELNNVKMLCLTVLKGHKRLAKDYNQPIACDIATERKNIIDECLRQQEKAFQIQLIALEMKEKAMRAHMRQLEGRVKKATIACKELTCSTQQTCSHAVNLVQTHLQVFKKRMTAFDSKVDALVDNSNSEITSMARDRQTTNRERQNSSLSTAPIVFSTPTITHFKTEEDDDVRSLLTEDNFVIRRPIRRILCVIPFILKM